MVTENPTEEPKTPIVLPQDIDSLVNEFDRTMSITGGKRGCVICEHPLRELVDTLVSRGAGGNSVSVFIERKFQIKLSSHSISKHKQLHVKLEG